MRVYEFQIAPTRTTAARPRKGFHAGAKRQARVRASLDLYSRILNKIELNNYDNFRRRAYTTKLRSCQLSHRACYPPGGPGENESGVVVVAAVVGIK